MTTLEVAAIVFEHAEAVGDGVRLAYPIVQSVTVAAEVMDELADGPNHSLDPRHGSHGWVSLSSLADDILLMRTRDEVEELVFALQDAADLVFPEPQVEPCVSPEDEAEFDAALAEVVRRAEHPIDFNRLVSATIRLRRAYLGCSEGQGGAIG